MFYRGKLTGSSEETNKTNHVKVHPLDANLISSEKPNGKHVLMLDLDGSIHFVKSSNNNHLYVDANLDLEALKEIIDVLAKHGVVQKGIKHQLDERGYLTLRPPGVKKGNELDDASVDEYKEIHEKSIIKLPAEYSKIPTPSSTNKYAVGGVISPVMPKHEKIQVPINYEQVVPWLKHLSSNIGQKLFCTQKKEFSTLNHEEYVIYGYSPETVDKLILATGQYNPMTDAVMFRFDSKTYPFNWLQLRKVIGV